MNAPRAYFGMIEAKKGQIGHLESVAGLAGLIKGILILENGMIPANINFDKPNPRIPFKEWQIAPSRKLTPWPTEGIRRLSVCIQKSNAGDDNGAG